MTSDEVLIGWPMRQHSSSMPTRAARVGAAGGGVGDGGDGKPCNPKKEAC